MTDKWKEYKGFVWPRNDDQQPGRRITIMARDSIEAMRLAKEEYGEDTIISLVNEEDANRVR